MKYSATYWCYESLSVDLRPSAAVFRIGFVGFIVQDVSLLGISGWHLCVHGMVSLHGVGQPDSTWLDILRQTLCILLSYC